MCFKRLEVASWYLIRVGGFDADTDIVDYNNTNNLEAAINVKSIVYGHIDQGMFSNNYITLLPKN